MFFLLLPVISELDLFLTRLTPSYVACNQALPVLHVVRACGQRGEHAEIGSFKAPLGRCCGGCSV